MPDDLHPQVRALLDGLAALNLQKVQDMEVAAARAQAEAQAAARRQVYSAPEMAEVQETSTGPGFGHVPVRIYRPTQAEAAPVIVYYHGGGHVICSLDTHDLLARHLAQATGCTLVSVDYRMGPEHPFPAAVHDSFDAARWVAAQARALRVDADRLVVCGDSAGGNLAAVVALMAQDASDFAVAAQVLIYPVTDYRGGTASSRTYAKGYGALEDDTMTWFMERYLPDPARRDDWRACPRNAVLTSDLPPALIVTAECDVLRDDGFDYANQLRTAGVPVRYVEYAGMIHGFVGLLGLVDDAAAAHETIATFLSETWASREGAEPGA
ncbi:alpha/beta hydrolase [Pseudooceanicola aestuarii]|uniref:alpha/beta hydrolase n=1 Tax=Pseudooceanicola aestuarii TaxID=2697319 RepID=UPI0013D3DFE1|nr:alpha/beta hydrolase [Pseudooceanicola aestuarii]